MASATPFWRAPLEFHNVGACLQKAESLGAKVIIPPTTLPNGGQLAVLHDPQGMAFGIMKTA